MVGRKKMLALVMAPRHASNVENHWMVKTVNCEGRKGRKFIFFLERDTMGHLQGLKPLLINKGYNIFQLYLYKLQIKRVFG
jgi:hypothetical protein